MPLQATAGAVSYDAYGGGIATAATYIEDIFQTWLYTGTGSGTQTITNGVDLAGKGGLVWIKSRTGSTATTGHALFDTARGREYGLATQLTGAQQGPSPSGNDLSSFNSDGFTVSATNFNWALNPSGAASSMASWTFRKQPKFFDVVTWTGDGNTSSRIISHSLGATPGFLTIKCTSTSANWDTFCRVDSTTLAWMYLNTAQPSSSVGGTPSYTTLGITSTGIDVAKIWLNSPTYPGAGGGNANGQTYVAYLFAHDAGGFGASGSDNVISCGSFTTDAGGVATVNLGYEPQWVLFKFNSSDSWRVFDNMRGMSQTSWNELNPNTSGAEVARTNQSDLNIRPSATGFTITWSPQLSTQCIYIAIRRGPMRTPTTGTSVYSPVTYTGNGSTQSLIAGFPIDLAMFKVRNQPTNSFDWFERLLGTSSDLRSAYTYAEVATTTEVTSFASNTQVSVGASSDTGGTNVSGYTYVLEAFQRAPGFFDVVCYTGTGTNGQTYSHNLGVVPELMIVKRRSGIAEWSVYSTTLGNTKYLFLNSTIASQTDPAWWNNTSPTASVFTVGTDVTVNTNGSTYVAYLFATVAGVSKVGSYTGTGTTLQVNCGFTGGARFVLIKRTDSTGDWYVWDSARGIVAGNDPYLLLNSTAAEVTSTDYVDTFSSGFEISSTAPAAINANGGTFIFLAIA